MRGGADVAFEAVGGKVRATEPAGFVGFRDAVDGEFGGRVRLVLGDEARAVLAVEEEPELPEFF